MSDDQTAQRMGPMETKTNATYDRLRQIMRNRLWGDGDVRGAWDALRAEARQQDETLARYKARDLDDMQRRVGEWHERNFPDATEPQRALIICEEVGELAHVILKQSQGIRPESATDAMLRDAMGDIVIATLALAAHRGWSLAEIISETAETVLARDWRSARAALTEGER